MSECTICVRTIDPEKIPMIGCQQCHCTACRECTETYLLSSRRPDCMFCHEPWDLIFVHQNLSPAFLEVWKSRWQDYLLRRERLLHKETMPYVQQRIRQKHLESEMEQKRSELRALENEYRQLQEQIVPPCHRFHMSCPKDGCYGFLDNNQCLLCSVIVCLECGRMNDQSGEHHCCEEDLLARKEIDRTTRSCPGCRSPIYRVSGCYQMWCTYCHTVFDWDSGKPIMHEIIHNPHYIEQIHDPSIVSFRKDIQQISSMQEKQKWLNLLSRLEWIQNQEIPRLLACRSNDAFRELRIRLIMGDISETRYKESIYAEDRMQTMNTYLMNMWNLFLKNGRVLLNERRKKTEDGLLLLYRLFVLVEQTNHQIAQINETFDCRIDRIL